VSIPIPDPIVTRVIPDTESKRAGRRSTHANADQSQQEILDDIYRYRGQLADTLDQLHTRLSPKYHIDQLKDDFKTAGLDALGIVKGEGKPVDESRAKNADKLVKGGSILGGLLALRTLRKAIKGHHLKNEIRQAIRKEEAHEKFEIHGLIEESVELGED
jgi:hypothetical protein